MIEPADYLVAVGVGLGITAAMLAPFFFALGVAYWPGRRPARKILFSVVSCLLTYGAGTLTFVLLVPIELAAVYLAPSWEDQGWVTVPMLLAETARAIELIALIVAVPTGIAAPLILRRYVWLKLFPTAP